MPIDSGGGGHRERKKQGDCNIFTFSRVQGVWPIFDASANHINYQLTISFPPQTKNLSNQGNMISITCCAIVK